MKEIQIRKTKDVCYLLITLLFMKKTLRNPHKKSAGISEFSKVAGDKVNISKLIIFLCHCNDHVQTDIKNSI